MNRPTMKAQVLERPSHLECRDVELPAVGLGDVLIRVRVCGISEMDRRVYTGECRVEGGPPVLGHEVLGTVEAMGAEVRGLEVGDRVCLDSGFQMGVRVYEKRGTELVEQASVPACLGLMGGLAEFMRAPAERCCRAPEQVDDYSASQAGHIVHVFQAMRGFRELLQSHEPMGASAAVLDSRAGFLLAGLIRFAGFTPVVAIGSGKENLDAAGRMGADVTIDQDHTEDVAEAALAALSGRGADFLVDAGGRGQVRPEALRLVADGGRLYSLELPGTADLSALTPPDPDAFPAVFKLLRYERINPRPAYTMAVPLENVGVVLREWTENARLLKAFMSTALRDDFYFEHYRSPVDATLYEK